MKLIVILLVCYLSVASAFWSSFWDSAVSTEDPVTWQGWDENSTYTISHDVTVQNDGYAPNLVDLARQLKLTRFVQHMERTKMDRVLNHERNFTVFAPSDEAYEKAPFYCNFTNEKEFVRFLVTKGSHMSSSLKNEQKLNTMLGRVDMRINTYRNRKMITASGMKIGKKDQIARNGIIHILDTISACYIPKYNIVEEVNSCPLLRTLAAAINKTNIYQKLHSAEPMTMFAPSDRAFKHLPLSVMKKILSNDRILERVVMNHVVPRSVYTSAIQAQTAVRSIQGDVLVIRRQGQDMMVNSSVIIASDLSSKNGVIHVIDKVLLPKDILHLGPTNSSSH